MALLRATPSYTIWYLLLHPCFAVLAVIVYSVALSITRILFFSLSASDARFPTKFSLNTLFTSAVILMFSVPKVPNRKGLLSRRVSLAVLWTFGRWSLVGCLQVLQVSP